MSLSRCTQTLPAVIYASAEMTGKAARISSKRLLES